MVLSPATLNDLGLLALRSATLDDARVLFKWHNEPLSRANSHNTRPVKWAHHITWLEKSLRQPARTILIAQLDGIPVGMCRADRELDCCEVSWSVAPEWRGRGIGRRMVQQLVQTLPGPVKAEIKVGNAPSVRLAQDIGMFLERIEGKVMLWRMDAAPYPHQR